MAQAPALGGGVAANSRGVLSGLAFGPDSGLEGRSLRIGTVYRSLGVSPESGIGIGAILRAPRATYVPRARVYQAVQTLLKAKTWWGLAWWDSKITSEAACFILAPQLA